MDDFKTENKQDSGNCMNWRGYGGDGYIITENCKYRNKFLMIHSFKFLMVAELVKTKESLEQDDD